MSTLIFAVTSLLFIIADLVVIPLALLQRTRDGRLLAATMTAAASVCLSYTISVTSLDYFAMSMASSVYFVSVDLTLLFLVLYLFSFTGMWGKGTMRAVLVIMAVAIVLDICSLMANPFTEAALTYEYDRYSIAHWRYVPLLPYQFHLFICYCMVGVAFVVLVAKSIAVPRVYRGRYLVIVFGLLFIVLVNAAFLYLPRTLVLDYSLMFYSVMGFFLYFSHFHYSGRSMLNATREMIIDQLGRSVILFDYEGNFVTCNSEAYQFVGEDKRTKTYTVEQFLDDIGLRSRIADLDANCSFQHRMQVGTRMLPYRFDFHVLRDGKGRLLGRLIVLGENSSEMDLLTGFHTKLAFEREYSARLPMSISYPVQVCVCDLNHLADLNNIKGRDAGDEAIRYLADLMVECLPTTTYFARHDDARLVAVCEGSDTQSIKECLKEVRSRLHEKTFGNIALDMQSALSTATAENPQVLDAAHMALSALRARKMLDVDSAHSSLLSSLSMALRQTDGETEEHVIRTRWMAEGLADRLGLSDWQKNSLSLLCLLHDVGKIGVPLEILNKPGRLSDAEWEMMKSHTVKGYEIAMASEELRDIADYILHHHECWDGSGYPDGLTQEAIPLPSRIVAVVDSFDAMTHDRPYRTAMPKDEAIEELKRCAGVQFDPTIVAEFAAMLSDMDDLESREFLGFDMRESQIPTLPEKMSAKAVLPADNVDSDIRPRLYAYQYAEFEPTGIYAVRYSKYILNEDQEVISVSGDFEEMTGYSWQDVQDYHLSQQDLLFPEDRQNYWDLAASQLEKNHEAYIDHRVRRKDGSPLKVFCYGRQYYDSAEQKQKNQIVIADLDSAGSIRNARDGARRSALRGIERWEDKARRDEITGLLNREAFRSDVQMRLLENDQDIVMMMLDVDHFKTFNDTFGHPEGDALLINMARALESAVGDDGVVCRMGGDEFAIVLFFESGSSREQMRKTSRRVWSQVQASVQLFSQDVTISAGAACGEEGKNTFISLYRLADKQLYRAKREGRNCFRCNCE